MTSTKLNRPALFSYGFRPFFLGGALWAAIAMVIWIVLITGHIRFATEYDAIAWHAHAFLFGYATAIVTGFLLTALPNWTGRSPIRGSTLITLFGLWLIGRIALLFTDVIGVIASAAFDSLFLISLAVIVFHEITASRNHRNLKVAVIILLLAIANVGFHAELWARGDPSHAIRATISLLVVLIMLIGGRIIPSFTRNWLTKRQSRNLPTPFNAFDRYAVGIAVLALVLWIVFPDRFVTGSALLLAGLGQSVRLSRWRGLHTVREPLVLILHLGYAFVPLGFFTVAGSVVSPQAISTTAALHAWTAGAVGVMTLAVMTRASRGHSGRQLTAPATTQLIYLLVIASALLRLATIIVPEMTLPLLIFASATWIAGFAAFALFYGPMLLGSPQQSQAH